MATRTSDDQQQGREIHAESFDDGRGRGTAAGRRRGAGRYRGAPLAIEPAAETLQPAAAGDASTPIREGAASKAAGSGGCGWGAKTAYLGS
ncbi:MAG: hypothetical protein JKP98_20305 [Rhodobacteraceae bacterium]|nr:hypothetical protein [Paracoccaceae bacterium]